MKINKILGVTFVVSLSSMALVNAKSVNIGSLQALTGPLESLIVHMSASADIAAREASDSGKFLGGTLINVARADSRCIEADVAVAEAERLINGEKVIAIMGPNCSGATTAVVNNVTVPNGVVTISPSATSPALSTIEDRGFFFRTVSSDARQGQVIANIAIQKGIKTVALTYTNNDYGKGLSNTFVAAYEKLGGKISISAAHEDGKADYSAEVAALSASGASVLAVFGYVDQGGKGIVQASLDTGAFDSFIFADGMISDNLTKLGAELNGSWGTIPSNGGIADEKWQKVAKANGVKIGGPYLGESYDAMALIVLSAQAANSTDRMALKAQVMKVANAPGEKIYAGELAKGLSLLAQGKQIDYVGASNIEFNAVGEVQGAYKEKLIVNEQFETIDIH
ncbi:MAG: ABC transporter substrate-binding protein [Gammaproteobacteria bacterium]|nr:ABC transporter substrate-binding protein [Gammaproteobacteria bacterium]